MWHGVLFIKLLTFLSLAGEFLISMIIEWWLVRSLYYDGSIESCICDSRLSVYNEIIFSFLSLYINHVHICSRLFI